MKKKPKDDHPELAPIRLGLANSYKLDPEAFDAACAALAANNSECSLLEAALAVRAYMDAIAFSLELKVENAFSKASAQARKEITDGFKRKTG